MEKKLDGNYARMLRAILNKTWRQYPTKHQLYGHQLPITKTIRIRRTKHEGHCWSSRDKLISDVLQWNPSHGRKEQHDQLKLTYSSFVRIRDLAKRTCQKRWTIGRGGERGSGISMLMAGHAAADDDVFQCVKPKYIYTLILCLMLTLIICCQELLSVQVALL